MENYSPKIISEEPLLVLPTLARDIGLNRAIALQQLHFWLSVASKKKGLGKFEDGRYWIYDSWKEWRENFPFWSDRTIRRTFESLGADGLVLTHEEADPKFIGGSRKWYSIDYDAVNRAVGQNPEDEEGYGQNDHRGMANLTTPSGQDDHTFTETTSETTPESNGSENLQGDLPSQPGGGTRPNRSMHQHTKGKVPQEPVLESDDDTGFGKLHALEIRIADVIASKTLGKKVREQLREPVRFGPEDSDDAYDAPSPIELWDLSDDYPAFVDGQIDFLRENTGGKVYLKSLMGLLRSRKQYSYFHKRHGIPGIGGHPTKPVTEVDGIELDEDEWLIMQMVGRGDKTLDEAIQMIREYREEEGRD